MTSFPGSPRLIKGGIVLIDPTTGAVQRVIALQYNPVSLQRSLTARTVGEDADRSQALRLTGPPQETYTLEAEIDAADQLEFPDQNPLVVEHGIAPQLAALETILYPPSSRLIGNNQLAASGVLEILPTEQPLMLFVWSSNRVVPVRLTSYSVTEEAFDPRLNPLRAKVSLGFKVLSVGDLGFDHRGGSIYLAYHQQVERLAARSRGGAIGDLGLTGIP
jgi:hypothetical protein